MPRYGFVSPGAMAARSIEEELLQRAEWERRAQLDALAQTKQAEELRLQGEDLKLRQGQLAGLNADRVADNTALEAEREFRRNNTLAENALPDDPTDKATYESLIKTGHVGAARKVPGVVSQGPQRDEIEGVPIYDVTTAPETYAMRGGSKYLSARAAAADKAEIAAAAAQAKVDAREDAQAATVERDRQRAEDRAAQDKFTAGIQIQLKGMGLQGSNEIRTLQADALRGRNEDAETKRVATAQKDARDKEAAQRTASNTRDTLLKLAKFNDDGTTELSGAAKNLFGVRLPGALTWSGSDTAVARANLKKLTSRAVLDLMGELKQQSRTGATGFGNLTERELGILEGAATILNDPNISNEAAAQAMRDIYDVVSLELGPGKGKGAAPTNDEDLLNSILAEPRK